MYLCFADLVDHIVQYAGANPVAQTVLNARGAAQTALRVLSTQREWNYFNSIFIVNVQGPYNTGTISYSQSTLAVTLTGGTWPSWAAYGYLVVDNATYAVASRDSNTQLTLQTYSNPGADIAALTAYNLRQDTFPVPPDFGAASSAICQPGIFKMTYVSDTTAATGRNYNVGTGRPQYFSVIADPLNPQQLAVRMWPSPNSIYHVQFTYRRKMMTPVYQRESSGLVTATASSAIVTGTTTNFASNMATCAIRLSGDAKTLPTGSYGDNPAQAELIIQSVQSPTSLTAATSAIATISNSKYVITSLLDLEPESMVEYAFREAERQYRLLARMKNTAEEIQARMEAYERACAADNRFFGRMTAGPVVVAGVFDFCTVIPST